MWEPKVQRFRPLKTAFGFNSLAGTIAGVGGILAIVIFAWLGMQGSLSTPELLTALLGSVGFLACTLVLERIFLFNKLDHNVTELLSNIAGPGAIRLLKYRDTSRPEDFLDGARDVFVYGLNKAGFFVHRVIMFAQLLETGCRIRVMLVDPEAPNLLESIAKNLEVDAARIRTDYDQSISTLRTIVARTSPQKRRGLTVRLWSAPPLMGAIIVDPGAPDARMILYFYTYQTDPPERPALEFRRSMDTEWFDRIHSSFESLWTAAAISKNPIRV